MALATRTDVLILELTSTSPGLFTYAEKQLLRSGEPDVIERVMDRKQRRLRWNFVGAFVFLAIVWAQPVAEGLARGQWGALFGAAIWTLLLPAYAMRVARDRSSMRAATARLLEHLRTQRETSRRAG